MSLLPRGLLPPLGPGPMRIVMPVAPVRQRWNGLSGIAQRFWHTLEWESPPLLERTLLPGLSGLRELALPIVKPYLDVCELRGRGKGSPLTVIYIGLPYGKWHLKSTMFLEEPVEIGKEPVSMRQLNEVVSHLSSDIVVVAAGERVVRALPSQNALILPLYVEQVLDLRGDWEDVKKRFRSSGEVRDEFRMLRKYGYSCELTHDGRDLEMYYQTMYLPTMEARHGHNAVVVSWEECQRHFRRGFLLLLERDGQAVAGGLCRARGETMKFITIGVANADERLMKQGAMGALYISLLRWANQAGYKAFDFLGCPPYPDMGVFQYKRKWGATVSVAPHLRKRVWLRFRRGTPAVRQFLQDNPFITIDENGDLYGLVFADSAGMKPEDRARLFERYRSPGLKDLIVRPVADFIVGQAEDREK